MVRWVGGNVGSYNTLGVRFETHERLADILNEKGDINGASFSEARCFDRPCAPLVNDKPFLTNEENLRSYQHGIINYATAETRPFIETLDINRICGNAFEITAFIITSKQLSNKPNKGKRTGKKFHQTLFIYAYKNHTIASSDLRDAFNKILKHVRTFYNCGRFIIHGDMNDPNFRMDTPGLINVEPDELAHKHRSNTTPSAIDKIITNVRDLKITTYRSVETYSNDHPECGHKIYLLEFDVAKTEPTVGCHLDLRLLKNKLKQIDNDAPDTGSPQLESLRLLNSAAADFGDSIKKLILECSRITFRAKRRKKHVSLEDVASTLASPDRTKSNPLKNLYDFVNNMRDPALIRDIDCDMPGPESLKNSLELKYLETISSNQKVVADTVEKLHGHEPKIKATFPERNFKKLVLSTNNSRSRDISGISLKTAKFIIKNSSYFCRKLEWICKESCRLGHFPDIWKMDKIIFIWKRKGQKSDPSTWRAITISNVFGKMLEKIVHCILSKPDDKNPENFAYARNRSTHDALIKLKNILIDFKFNNKNKNVIPIICLDDIKGAFESIDSHSLRCIIQARFEPPPISEVDLCGLIDSFFRRKSVIKNTDGQYNVEIQKPYPGKSAPQGSILSPLLWRWFDGILTKIFLDSLEALKSKLPCLKSYNHLSYSDDKIYVLTVEVSDTKKLSRADKIAIETSVAAARNCLQAATVLAGSSLNMAKSETVVYDDFVVHINKSKNEWVWLGFSLRLDRQNMVVFTFSRIQQKKFKLLSYLRYITSVSENPTIKMKIYEVYVRPILEYFAICYELTGHLQSFQLECLCICMDVPRTSSHDKVLEFTGSPSFKLIQILRAKQIMSKFTLQTADFPTLSSSARLNQQNLRPALKHNVYDFFTTPDIWCGPAKKSTI